jgi:CheY-like chemotaxis protein
MTQPIEILLVEDNPGDVRLTQEALRDGKIANHLQVSPNGRDALARLRGEGDYADAPRPDLILLDLNLPGMDGRQVLQEIKEEESLANIPVVVMTSSAAEEDVVRSYALHANCYVTKPLDFGKFTRVVQAVEEFWVTVVKLPERKPDDHMRS